jgi:hypothetical protein
MERRQKNEFNGSEITGQFALDIRNRQAESITATF